MKASAEGACSCFIATSTQATRSTLRPAPVRIGVHTGDIIVEGDDIFGDGVNVAARLQAIAEPAGICVSQRVYDEVRDRLPAVHPHGERSVKPVILADAPGVGFSAESGYNRLEACTTGAHRSPQTHGRSLEGAMPDQDLSRYFAEIELRVDSHYTDGVVSLGTIVELFGMAGTKLAYMIDGDGGLMRAFETVEFLAPVYHADFVRATARLLAVGRTSRRRSYELYVTARTHGVGSSLTHGEALNPPILAARAIGTSVTPLDRQRLTPAALRRAS